MNTSENNKSYLDLLQEDKNIIEFINSITSILFKMFLFEVYNNASNGDIVLKQNNILKLRLINCTKRVKELVPWLDESTEFVFGYNTNENTHIGEISIRNYSGDGCILRKTENGYKICNASIYVPLNINISDFDFDDNDSVTRILFNKVSSLRSHFIHELSHVYSDYKNMVLNEEHIKSKQSENFDSAYSRIIKNISSSDKNERYFCNVVYYVNDYESIAHISGFYQSLLDCIEIEHKRIKNIDQYSTYKTYLYINEAINNFNDTNVFKKHKTDVIYIFGVSCNSMNSFKINVSFQTDHILNNIMKMYSVAKDIESDYLKYNQNGFDLDYAEKVYNEYIQNEIENKIEDTSEDYKPIQQIYFEKYKKSPIDIHIKILNMLIKMI